MTMKIKVVIAARGDVRERIRNALTEAGFVIATESNDPADALAAVTGRRPHVCVLDRGLPGAGLSTIAALATIPRRPYLLVIGGQERAADVRAALLAGADRCLPGAIDAERVVAAVSELIGDSKGEG
jgi:DNA-binding NarL/FixJ family response regulator